MVEIEDWNEYGELKQHVQIVHDGGSATTSAAPTPSGTPSKAPVSQENNKPKSATASSSKAAEESKPPVGGAPTAFTLAMRQAGQEAAQKAKDGKKKPVETFDGVGEAEPVKKDLDNPTVIPAPISVLHPPPEKHTIEGATILQSPTSSAWRRAPGRDGKRGISRGTEEKPDSLQSPNSTAWRPTDTDLPVLTHRGSSVSQASAEEIKQVEQDETIPEEDEDALDAD